MLDYGPSDPKAAEARGPATGVAVSTRHPGAAPLRVGLLNNMPDAAFVRTEAQFRALLGSGVALSLFDFRATPRSDAVAAHVAAGYAPHDALPRAGLDALVVTGCEPRAARLEDEPFYAPLSAVVDWAADNTVSTLFSCLASHVAVLHLDGIRRRRLPVKYSGVYACEAVRAHPLLRGQPEAVPTPHSRWNDLAEADLAAAGYTVLRRSAEVGVDLFVRDEGSLFVFLQGHPEYDADSLAREYRRDFGRYLEGTGAACPLLPPNYFSEEGERVLRRFAEEACAGSEAARLAGFPDLGKTPLRPASWQMPAARLFANWLACVAERIPRPARQPIP